MSRVKREFVIPFVGLKPGNHDFEFSIDDSFFEDLTYSLIHSGKVHVDLMLEKKENMLIGHFSCEGKVFADCDRCNAPMEVFVSGSLRLVFKFSDEVSDDESLIVLAPEAYELDVTQHIYELITVSLPVRKVHDEGECDPEMLEALNAYLLNPEDDEDEDDDLDWEDEDEDDEEDGDEGDDDDDDIDPRWSALKNLN